MGPEATVERAAIPAWRTQIDTARQRFERGVWLLAQQSEPSVDLAPLGGVAREGIAAIYDALDARSDRLDGVRRATQRIDAICAVLAEDSTGSSEGARATLQEARAALDEDMFSQTPSLATTRLHPEPKCICPCTVGSAITPRSWHKVSPKDRDIARPGPPVPGW